MKHLFSKNYFSSIAALCLALLLAACGGGNADKTPTDNFSVAVFSDVHFNPYYDTKLFSSLVLADPSQWANIFKTSTITGLSGWGSDTNYPSLALALSGVKQNLGTSPMVIFTGDILGHNFSQTFFSLYYANLGLPVPSTAAIETDATAVAAMETFADNTVAFFMDQVRSSVGNLPIMFALGNADSYLGGVPEPSFLKSNAENFYSKFLQTSADHNDFLTTFKSGGYYSAQAPGANVTVIALNTLMFVPALAGHPMCEHAPPCDDLNTLMFVPALAGFEQSAVDAELLWLDKTLAAAQAAGKKVWLLMHVPPGADIYSTATKNYKGSQTASATMMWEPQYQASFLKTVSNYPGLITFTLAAHTHMDEYRIYAPGNVLEITPSITPIFGNNPAFKVFSFAQDSLRAIDYSSFNYDLATNPLQFNKYYTFSDAYSMQGFLDASRTQLFAEMTVNGDQQALYRKHYFSGHNYSIPVANTFKQITDSDWPVYWCGIGKMPEQELIDCLISTH